MTTQVINTGIPQNLRNPTAYHITKQFVFNDNFCKRFIQRKDYQLENTYDRAADQRYQSVLAMYSLAGIDSDIKKFLTNNQLTDWDKMRKLYQHFREQELYDRTK